MASITRRAASCRQPPAAPTPPGPPAVQASTPYTSRVRELLARWADYEDVTRASALLEWDQETGMPEGGTRARGLQVAALAGVAHQKLVSPAFRRALRAAAGRPGLTARQRAMVREAGREHGRARRLPEALVRRLARVEAEGVAAWRTAYRRGSWRAFAGHLATMVALKRQVAERVGYRHVPYDAHLDAYEPGATVRGLDPLLDRLREVIVPLVQRIGQARRQPDPRLLRGRFPADRQLAFGRQVVEAMGFDFTRGRIDLSMHPFCTALDPGDVRLTTRVDEGDLRECLFGLMHEAGHGLYEQGIAPELIRTPLGHAVSLGIHESQSRLWENMVGRSRAFWRYCLPRLRRAFPELRPGGLLPFVFAVNEVRPSYIRTEADEVTYSLHVVLRYEIEKDLFAGRLATSELPAAWNRRTKALLGLVPPTPSQGVLQDIHWAMGLFGYFPTYALGNLYAAQLWEQARHDLPDLEAGLAAGRLAPLRAWLGRSVHAPGRTHSASDLLRRATGRPLEVAPFTRYLHAKYTRLYDL
jgi:carboxypeptidase Taq